MGAQPESPEKGLETETMVVKRFSSGCRVQHVDIKQRNCPSEDLARRKAKRKV